MKTAQPDGKHLVKKPVAKNNFAVGLRRKANQRKIFDSYSDSDDQVTKGAGWMPWHWTPKKDVVSCEKPRGAASRL